MRWYGNEHEQHEKIVNTIGVVINYFKHYLTEFLPLILMISAPVQLEFCKYQTSNHCGVFDWHLFGLGCCCLFPCLPLCLQLRPVLLDRNVFFWFENFMATHFLFYTILGGSNLNSLGTNLKTCHMSIISVWINCYLKIGNK